MSRRTVLTALVLWWPAVVAAQGATAVTKFTAGGITVIHKQIAANDVVAARLYLRGGAAALTPSTAGIERFIGEVSTHGTEKYTKDQFAHFATITGTNIGSAVDFDYTVFTLQAVRQHWDEAWGLFVQATLHPTFPADEVEQVRGQIRDDLAQRLDTPDGHLQELGDSVLYAGHPYAVDPNGTADVIGQLTRDELVAWHRRRLTKANLLLVVVGNLPRADLASQVAAAFAGLPDSGGGAAVVAPLGAGRAEVALVQQDLPTNYILGLYPAPGPSSPDYPALRVATRVLSERLLEEVRTKRNLSYAVFAGLDDRVANRGILYVTAVDPDTTLRVMQTEVHRMQREAVPAQRLAQSVNVFLTSYLMSQQTNMGQAGQLGLWELFGGGWANASAYLNRVRAVEPADVQRVARQYMQHFAFAMIGDTTKVNRAFMTAF
jgi:zinc protease